LGQDARERELVSLHRHGQPDLSGIGELYAKTYDSLTRLGQESGFEPGVGFSDIKLLPKSDPIIQAALAIQRRGTGLLGRRITDGQFGPMYVEEAYIYPPLGKMTQDALVAAIMTLMIRRGSSQIHLTNGNKVNANPVGLNFESDGRIRVTLHDLDKNSRIETLLEDIDSIR
jgi:hypothetical protein